MAKKKPQTAQAYAKYLYDFDGTTTAPITMEAKDIIACRVAAFVDGVNWERRRRRSTARR